MRTKEQNRKLYWLFNRLTLNEDVIDSIVSETTHGRTTSTADLTFIEAMELIRYLEQLVRKGQNGLPESLTIDKKRKGLIKAIFSWYDLQGKQVDMNYVKATACRAAGVEVKDFNKITEATLTRLYAEFSRKQVANKELNRGKHQFFNN